MIILDTNVVSEPLKPSGNSAVLEWLDEQDIETLYLTAITVAELRFGIAALPLGKRKHRLEEDFEKGILALFKGIILPFDEEATVAYARIRAKAKAEGKAIGITDGFIAAIAMQHNFAVATRDVSPFVAAGVSVIDPWGKPSTR
jgi:predicted nucleic acid-binding protein